MNDRRPEQRGEAFEENNEEVEEEQETPSSRVATAKSLTGQVDETMESQSERDTKAKKMHDLWEEEASDETEGLLDGYDELESDLKGSVEWTMALDSEVGELVDDDLEYGEGLTLAEYGETQSGKVEGLTGNIRRWANKIASNHDEIENKREDIQELRSDKEDEYSGAEQELEDMDEEDIPEGMTPAEFLDSEYEGIDTKIERQIEELEEDIDELQERKVRAVGKKKSATSERSTRRDEAQQVYNEVAGEAERVVTENTDRLQESLTILRELESQEGIYTENRVENGIIDQRQDDQAEARTEVAMAYVAEALSQTEEMEAAVKAHDRLKSSISEAVDVDTRELQSIYEDLANPEAVEEDVEEGDYGFNVLKQRILESADKISEDGYDSIRELRDFADQMDVYNQ